MGRSLFVFGKPCEAIPYLACSVIGAFSYRLEGEAAGAEGGAVGAAVSAGGDGIGVVAGGSGSLPTPSTRQGSTGSLGQIAHGDPEVVALTVSAGQGASKRFLRIRQMNVFSLSSSFEGNHLFM